MANGAFTQFQTSDIINSIDSTTGTVWSGNAPRLTEVYTSSVQNASNSGQYYIHVYQTGSTLSTAAIQFDIASKYCFRRRYSTFSFWRFYRIIFLCLIC